MPNVLNLLQSTAKALPRLDEDGRILPVLENLSQGFIAGVSSEYASSETCGDAITAEMIDDMAQKHFPLCMRNLHDTLRKDRHLKHHGRLQYGLFLKVRRALFTFLVSMLKKRAQRLLDSLSRKPSSSGEELLVAQ